MIPTMIMSFLVVGMMFFLTANEERKSPHKIKESIIKETQEVVKVVIEKEKSVAVIEPQIVESEVIVISETQKVSLEVKEANKSIALITKKVKKILLSEKSKKEKAIKEENPIAKVEVSKKKTKVENSQPNIAQTDILPTIPTVPKVKNYEIKIPVPEKSLIPVQVTEINN